MGKVRQKLTVSADISHRTTGDNFEIDIPEDALELDKAVAKYSSDYVLHKFVAGFSIALQGALRNFIDKCVEEKKQVTQKMLQDFADNWSPKVGRVVRTDAEKVAAEMSKATGMTITVEQAQAMIDAEKAKAAKAAKANGKK